MSKKAISVTLDDLNVLWLRGRTSAAGARSISETLDRLVTEARTSGRMTDTVARSVVGTIDIAAADSGLETADAALRAEMDMALRRPVAVRERRASRYGGPEKRGRRARR